MSYRGESWRGMKRASSLACSTQGGFRHASMESPPSRSTDKSCFRKLCVNVLVSPVFHPTYFTTHSGRTKDLQTDSVHHPVLDHGLVLSLRDNYLGHLHRTLVVVAEPRVEVVEYALVEGIVPAKVVAVMERCCSQHMAVGPSVGIASAQEVMLEVKRYHNC